MDRPDTASGTNSEMGLSNVSLNRMRMLPEQWTLPNEWNIEKREMFANWKMDVQEQIKFLDRQLGNSLNRYPTLAPIQQGRLQEEEEDNFNGYRREPSLVVGRMQYGLKRS